MNDLDYKSRARRTWLAQMGDNLRAATENYRHHTMLAIGLVRAFEALTGVNDDEIDNNERQLQAGFLYQHRSLICNGRQPDRQARNTVLARGRAAEGGRR
jgi:hypothetical protein